MTKKSAKKTTKAGKAGATSYASLSVATDSTQPVKARLAALAQAPTEICESDTKLQSVLGILRNQQENIDLRLGALQAMQAASFSVVAFESCRKDYIAALREVAQDPNPELRQRALGLLARDKDGFAQKKLMDGLKDPSKELVPPEKALQLLSYDVHSEAYPIAREIVKKSNNPTAKREALRLLAADSNSVSVFEKVLLDKSEMKDNRQIAASALHSLKPDKLQKHAREILMDSSDYADIQGTSLTALTQFGDAKAIEADKPLQKRVATLSSKGSAPVKKSAKQFITKYNE